MAKYGIASLDGLGFLTRQGRGAYTLQTLTGTPKQVIITHGEGNGTPTFALPQDIDVDSTPTFAGINITGTGDIVASLEDLELELAFKMANLYFYREFAYDVDGLLVGVGSWADNTKALKLFQLDLSYTGSDLTGSVLTRISDSATLTKVFGYTSGNLTSITRS